MEPSCVDVILKCFGYLKYWTIWFPKAKNSVKVDDIEKIREDISRRFATSAPHAVVTDTIVRNASIPSDAKI